MQRRGSSVIAPESERTDHWHHRAACKGQFEIFVVPDKESHPKLEHGLFESLRKQYLKKALAICMGCAVRRECEESRIGYDGLVDVRGGISPYDRQAERPSGVHLLPSERPVGRPKKDPTTARPTPQRRDPERIAREAEEFGELLVLGHTTTEIRELMNIGSDRQKLLRNAFLAELAKTPTNCDISSTAIKGGARKATPGKLQGRGWLLSASSCGRVVLVAIKQGDLTHVRKLRAAEVTPNRINGRVLERFPLKFLRESDR